MKFLVLVLLQSAVLVLSLPVDQNPPRVQWIDSDDSREFLSPEDNLVEPPDYNLIEDQPFEETKGSPADPEARENFITGHRIPLELFSPDTLRRIELIPDEEPTPATTTTTTTTTSERSRYVDSKSFRLDSPLGIEIDRQFESTVDKFVPDY